MRSLVERLRRILSDGRVDEDERRGWRRMALIGTVCGTAVAITIIVAIAWCAVRGVSLPGWGGILTGIAVIVGALVHTGRQMRRAEQPKQP